MPKFTVTGIVRMESYFEVEIEADSLTELQSDLDDEGRLYGEVEYLAVQASEYNGPERVELDVYDVLKLKKEKPD